jgi:hypothetical protein
MALPQFSTPTIAPRRTGPGANFEHNLKNITALSTLGKKHIAPKHHIPEGSNLHSHCHDNLKFHASLQSYTSYISIIICQLRKHYFIAVLIKI